MATTCSRSPTQPTLIRQLCFDQDHNYCLTLANDGRFIYLRWEYTDIPHVWARRLFTMNPDGTCQREFYGSGDFWPNAIFYARPIPDHPTKVVGIVTGHHVGRVGELVIFDAERGRNAASGVVQRIPGRGKPVEPIILDKLTEESWPKFLNPYPYRDDDARNEPLASDRCAVRGGSWYDRPNRCRSGFRLSYPAWQKVYNVGFRVISEVPAQLSRAGETLPGR